MALPSVFQLHIPFHAMVLVTGIRRLYRASVADVRSSVCYRHDMDGSLRKVHVHRCCNNNHIICSYMAFEDDSGGEKSYLAYT